MNNLITLPTYNPLHPKNDNLISDKILLSYNNCDIHFDWILDVMFVEYNFTIYLSPHQTSLPVTYSQKYHFRKICVLNTIN